jgi:hypothetical protein
MTGTKGVTYTGTDLSRVVEDNDLGVEGSSLRGGLVLGVRTDCTLADVHGENEEEKMKRIEDEMDGRVYKTEGLCGELPLRETS